MYSRKQWMHSYIIVHRIGGPEIEGLPYMFQSPAVQL